MRSMNPRHRRQVLKEQTFKLHAAKIRFKRLITDTISFDSFEK